MMICFVCFNKQLEGKYISLHWYEFVLLHPVLWQGALAAGRDGETLVELTQALVEAIASYKGAAASVKSLMPKAKGKAKAKAKAAAAPAND